MAMAEQAVPAARKGPRFRRLRALAGPLLLALASLLLISFITFVGTAKSGREVAIAALGRDVSEAQLEQYADARGLNDPVVTRYTRWLGDFVQGDWGVSAVTARPVRPDVMPRFERTLLLAVITVIIATPLSLLLGVYMARRAGSLSDLTLSVGTVVVTGLPEFVIGMTLLLIFGVILGWFPVDGTAFAFGSLAEQMHSLVLPVITMVIAFVPYTARLTRAAAQEALSSPSTQAAMLRGLPRRTVLWDHAMRSAAPPILNALALNAIWLVSGVIVVESVFGIPGIGAQLVESIAQGDSETVQAIAVLLGALFIGINLIADLAVVYANPKLRAR
jgi:peptide/nickel transport system permease protein